ncbi:topoisomerase DNA-binding C4 zinc finger domain-containing protein [Cohnella ginsengisoli]|uniref:Topoisomerase DNA-binding C4 zinc finger domain-containing protein n=1 Tax=Cohnella ginsengisoli TaxID=425004 RepID=A0A9X4KDN5_9BACL|nr:3'-5' exonuclease [Cohnella ginsengisoli]MDG0789970.1 topoisomerase DNA-binding C4 zinc finger domain-containing protein [Cohnella ginsengisoli]
MMIKYRRFRDLKITFFTAHRSKGLEAENVIIINAKNSLVGFPNKIADDPILGWVLTERDNFDFAEERRLFYVAITRTKNRCIILAPETGMSVFVKELIDKHQVPYSMVTDEESMADHPNCPRCRTGYLVTRQGNGGQSFLGCSNYPGCEYRVRYIQILKDKKDL